MKTRKELLKEKEIEELNLMLYLEVGRDIKAREASISLDYIKLSLGEQIDTDSDFLVYNGESQE